MGTGRKLLLADDSITIQKVVNLTFADEGLEVTTVSNGDLAVEKIEDLAPDIVLADVHMPGLNGYEVCEYVKRNERFRHIPVMLLVGSFEPFNEAEARRVGADDYLTKPFQSIRQLVGKVSSLLGGKQSAPHPPAGEALPPATAQEGQAQGGREMGADAPDAASMAPTVRLSEESLGEETVEMRARDFADPSQDDEMIEATPAGDFNLNRTISSSQRPTTPLSVADLEEAGINLGRPAASNQKPVQPSTINMQDTLPMPEEARDDIAQTQLAPTTRLENAAAADDALLDLDEVAPPRAAEADDFILDIWDESPAPSSQMTAEAPAPVTAAAVEEAEVSPAPAVVEEFVEAEVIEAEPLLEATPVEEPHAWQEEAMAAELSAPMTEEPQAEAPVMAEPVAAAAPAQTGHITLDQLSPEAIEAIARRAVELLSAKVIEQIAWEVVPDLAERLIKRRLEEERAQQQ